MVKKREQLIVLIELTVGQFLFNILDQEATVQNFIKFTTEIKKKKKNP